MPIHEQTDEQQRQRRWRLVLGEGGAETMGYSLSARDAQIDAALNALYETGGADEEGERDRRGGLEGSAPRVARWLGDIREYFPTAVVRVLQQDAMERLNMRQLLLEPEILQSVTADVHLVATLMSLRNLAPAKAKATMRQVVQQVVDELMRRLTQPMEEAVRGSLNRALRNNRPRPQEINWDRTIRANLKHYQPAYKTVIAERLIGYGRQQRQAAKAIVLCVDQSGSMAASVVYASIFAAVLASIPALQTQLVVFDTAVVDLSDLLADPVDVLFATQLGGGTDINRAIAYCETRIDRPTETTLILISDLYEGGNSSELVKRVARLVESGVNLITLLALNDDGAPAYDHRLAQQFADLGAPAFACTPDLFPDLMGAALQRQELAPWLASRGIAQG